jgi:Holliday junction resolvase
MFGLRMSRGHQRERAVKLRLESEDWWVARAAGSLGDADLVALKAGKRPMLIEVKSTAGGPYERFGPAARQRLIMAAWIAGADAVLAWWPPRGQLRLIPADEWPKPLGPPGWPA